MGIYGVYLYDGKNASDDSVQILEADDALEAAKLAKSSILNTLKYWPEADKILVTEFFCDVTAYNWEGTLIGSYVSYDADILTRQCDHKYLDLKTETFDIEQHDSKVFDLSEVLQ